MLHAYRLKGRGLERVEVGGAAGAPVDLPADAVWLDLYRPLPEQAAAVEALGVTVPTLEDMEEIEISNRLFHEDGSDNITVVLPGQDLQGEQSTGPVTFILTPERLVTVRHHAPRPFETFPPRADRSSAGCGGPERVFLGLVEDIVGRLADLLEGVGKALDESGRGIFRGGAARRPAELQAVLEELGRQGEMLGRVRLGVMTMERALSFWGTAELGAPVKALVKGEMRDLAALAVHVDFLSTRVGLMVDATLGMINLAQTATVRIISVVAALFLPPTLVASAWGMNHDALPWIHSGALGYWAVIAMMVGSALCTWLVFRWKKWL